MTRELAVHHYCRSRTARQRLSPRCYHAVFTIHINHSQCHCKDEDTPRGQIVPEDVMRGKRLAVVRRAPHAPRCSRTSLLSCCKRLTQNFHHKKKTREHDRGTSLTFSSTLQFGLVYVSRALWSLQYHTFWSFVWFPRLDAANSVVKNRQKIPDRDPKNIKGKKDVGQMLCS